MLDMMQIRPAFPPFASRSFPPFAQRGPSGGRALPCGSGPGDAAEKKLQKKFRENLEDMRKTPYLCIRFPEKGRRVQDERSLTRLHKQYT